MLAATAPVLPLTDSFEGPRAAAVAEFFTQARTAHALTVLPPFMDGDCVTCPEGWLWMRHHGQWVTPGHPDGLTLSDHMVTRWWQQRARPGTQFALVHRLAPNEVHRVAATRYNSHFHGLSITGGQFTHQETVTGAWLRYQAAQATHSRTISVHLELPSGIVTIHSRIVGDVFYRPADIATRY
ncbi:hypothetical protein ABZ864_40835 [Streptomyces sp. NPDC047082]|uniref:hypothetical protein n=1 Tax=Streptomyces sp. NPDC047082 TaxID=3155259 RepID=UPI0034038DCB